MGRFLELLKQKSNFLVAEHTLLEHWMSSRMGESSRETQTLMNIERSTDDLTNFIRTNTTSVDTGFLCMMCGTLIRQKTNLRRHFLDKHVDDGVHYHCPHCNRTYRSRNSFTSHISATHKDWKKADINRFAVQKPD